MIRKITLLFLLCVGVSHVTYAQPRCASDDIHKQMLTNDPNYAARFNKANNELASWLSNNPNANSLISVLTNGDTVIEIPVVVHIMHTGGTVGSTYNITDTRVTNTIDYLNQTYAASWSAYPNPANGGTKMPIKFALAKRDPNCNTTNGINRVDVTSFTDYNASGYDYAQYGVRRNNPIDQGVRDDSLKRLIGWDPERYYNIWVVNKIDGNDGTSGSFIAGYALLPPAPADRDGTVILATQMNINRQTLPHELGHALALRHTFYDDKNGTVCPPVETGANCASINDFCCDTQPHIRTGPGSCDVGNNTCHSVAYTDATARNFMNYANCTDRFTPDQRTRMLWSIYTFRSSLLTSSASLAASSVANACTPGTNNPATGGNYGPRNITVLDLTTTNPVYGGARVCMDVTSSGYNGDGNVAYRDLTCQHRLVLQAGRTYSINVGSNFNERGAVFIDYNGDGNLGNSSGERLSISDNVNGDSHTDTFTVPLTVTTCTPVRMRVISDAGTSYIDSCSNVNRGQVEDFEVYILGNPNSNDTVTIADPPDGGNPSCIGTQLTFRATPSTGTTIAGYKWYINSTEVTGAVGDTLQGTSIFNDKDTVQIKMYFSTPCGYDSVLSNKIVVERRTSIPPAVGLLIDKGTNPTCIDDTITFKADLISNPGPSPTFQWRSNGVNIAGATGQTFEAYNRVGQEISVIMFSSAGAPCATPNFAISDTIKIRDTTKRPVASIALTIGTNPGCVGQQLQFTATPQTGGTTPQYQWTVNGTPVVGATGQTFNTATLSNNDLVRVIMTSNSACASPKTVTSDSIKVIHQKITADITIAQTTGNNPNCEGKPVIFSANTTNAGKNPTFQWILDGKAAVGATSPIYSTDSLKDNTDVQCVLIATDPCVANPRDTSAPINMKITPSNRPKVTVSITAGKNPGCLDSLVEFTATPVDLGTNPAFEWIVNGFSAGTNSTFSSSSLLNGNTVLVRANQTDGGCYLPDTVYSQPIVMVRSETPKPPVISLIGNTMYTNFDSSFVWFGPGGEQIPYGPAGKAHPDSMGKYWAVTNNNGCWSPPSNILGITLLDISSIDLSDMKVYPNPTSDKVVLDWNGKYVEYSIDVYNAAGQVVAHEEANGVSRKEISLRDFANGNYFLLLKDTDGKVGVVKVTLGKNY